MFMSGPRSYGGGTWAIDVTFGSSAQSSARFDREQNSRSTGARCAVRFDISVTKTSTFKRLARATWVRAR